MENQENLDEFVRKEDEFIRADGRCICEACGKEYWRHPFSEHRSWMNEPFLNRLCDGTLVKL